MHELGSWYILAVGTNPHSVANVPL